MPRKFGYSQFDDDDYDGYDDYDDYYDDYDNREEYNNSKDTEKLKGNNTVSSQKIQSVKETVKKPVWTCSICTFDNDESLIVCEICGVFRESFVKAGKDAKLNGNGVSGNSQTSPVAKTQSDKMPVKSPNKEFISENHSETASTSYGKGGSAQSKGKIVKTITLSEESESTEKMSSINTKNSSQTLDSNLRQLNLNKDQPSGSNPISDEQYKPEKWMEAETDKETLNQLNLAIVGHVDSGKSTLSGRLLHLLGKISKREMHKNEKEAKEKGKGSFAVAWALDESKEERERGVTMTVGVAYFESKKYKIVILDSPGHKDFVPNLISGANQADAAILVVDACKGSFEAGMEGQVPGVVGVGQTKEHAQLVKAFGVDQLIVAVNKMDSVNYSKERYDEIKTALGAFLRSCNFKDSSVTWVPLSAMENQNLVGPASDSRLTSWYKGVCLLDAIDSLQPPLRDVSKPLILPICDVIRTQMGQVAACGKLETGAIKTGSKVVVMPGWHAGTVKSIEQNSSPCSVARAGDSVAVVVQGVDQSQLMPGGVLCHPDFPVLIGTRLELKIRVLDIGTPILAGSQVEFHIHHAKTAARIIKMLSLIDQKTGKISKTAPRFLKAKQLAVIEVGLDGPVCVQEYAKCRALGRAFLRSSGNTVAVGIVTRIIDQD
ncbi:hypothetical protein LUZ60_014814 [Juncus effusus]|nr:hypothetical protein LUZ60_014814 [Juncus effusus]